MPTADDLLVERSRQGDLRAFNILVRRWEKRIYNFILKFVGRHEDAQDLCQETFVRAYEKLDRLEDASRFRRWLYAIAANLSRDRLKSCHYRRTVSLEELPASAAGRRPLPVPPPGAGPAPDEELRRAEVRAIVLEALLRIPESQRLALVLRTYHGMTTVEIAELTGEPPGTIRSRIFHGLRRMQAALDEMGVGKEDMTDGLQ